MGALQELRLAGERRLTLPVVFDDENRPFAPMRSVQYRQVGNGRSIAAAADVGGADSLDLYPSGAAAKRGQVPASVGLSAGLLLA